MEAITTWFAKSHNIFVSAVQQTRRFAKSRRNRIKASCSGISSAFSLLPLITALLIDQLCIYSSEDSLNATVQESEGYYDGVINSSVTNLLALNHETESQ
jgi:hypothetical protein